jgi:hypothetical protein
MVHISLPGYHMILQKLQEQLKSKKWEHVMNYSMYITLSKADKKTLQPFYVKLSTLLLTHGSIIYECTLQEVEKEYAKYLYDEIGQQEAVSLYDDLVEYFAGKYNLRRKNIRNESFLVQLLLTGNESTIEFVFSRRAYLS